MTKVVKKDLERAVGEGVISASQAEALWRMLEVRDTGRPRFDVAHLAYYLGAMVVISAMTWFMTLAWERFGGWGIFGTSLAYAAVLGGAGWAMWQRRDLRVPGGMLVSAAVCMTPLVVYGFERATGLWLQKAPGQYEDFYRWIQGGWFLMEIVTLAAGILALYFVRFPFITAPMAFTLWFMSMDITPLIYGEHYYEAQGYQTISIVFGLVMLLGSFLVDQRTEEDYAFWGYLFGMLTFWGGLTALEGGSELEWFGYGAINLGLMLLSVLLQRRVFMVFGALGVFGYVGHLAWTIFEDSLIFPFVLSGVGLVIIALGILYARNAARLENAIISTVPAGMRSWLPRER
jgi:hypothetical protein